MFLFEQYSMYPDPDAVHSIPQLIRWLGYIYIVIVVSVVMRKSLFSNSWYQSLITRIRLSNQDNYN